VTSVDGGLGVALGRRLLDTVAAGLVRRLRRSLLLLLDLVGTLCEQLKAVASMAGDVIAASVEPPLPGFTLFRQGAEARLFRGHLWGALPAVAKHRFPKSYRHPQLDQQLTQERLRAEARSLARCLALGVPSPAVYMADADTGLIVMEDLSATCGAVTTREFIEVGKEIIHPFCCEVIERFHYFQLTVKPFAMRVNGYLG
jgi:hypothetical protein